MNNEPRPPAEQSEAQRSLTGALATDANTIVTGVTTAVGSAVGSYYALKKAADKHTGPEDQGGSPPLATPGDEPRS